MKKLYSIIVFALIIANAYAQSGNRIKPVESQIEKLHAAEVRFEKENIFSVDNTTLERATQMQSVVRNATVLNVNKASLASILQSSPEQIEFSVPFGAEFHNT